MCFHLPRIGAKKRKNRGEFGRHARTNVLVYNFVNSYQKAKVHFLELLYRGFEGERRLLTEIEIFSFKCKGPFESFARENTRALYLLSNPGGHYWNSILVFYSFRTKNTTFY